MRIISKFHDYYDNIGYHSEYPVWVRKTQEYYLDGSIPDLSFDEQAFLKDMSYSMVDIDKRYIPFHFITQSYTVSVCGDLYTILTITETKNGKDVTKAFTDIEKFVDTVTDDKEIKDLILGKKRCFFMSDRYYIHRPDSVKEFHRKFGNRDILDKIHINLDSPIFMVNHSRNGFYRQKGGELIVNPNMRNIGLHHIIDVYTMHQKIDMYLGNTLVKDKEAPEFSDELKRDAHGMDNWSFKKRGVNK